MATTQQEQIYNEIIEYYAYADRLIRAVEDSSHKLSEQQFAIVEEITQRLEDYTDKLTNTYIEFVKNGSSEQSIDSVRAVLNGVSATIEQCRNKILMLYQNSES